LTALLSIIEARERLYARLWTGECAVDDNGKLAIAGHRLWCALCEQRFRADADGHRLTEGLRRTLFSAAELSVDAEGFAEWITGVVPLTGPPSAPFITAVEAVYFLAWGAFLTLDDITAITAAQIEIAGSVQTVGTPRNTPWELAEQRLFRAHVEGALTLLGRRALHFGADPTGDLVPIARKFFAGRVTLGLINNIHNRDDAARPMYCEIAVSIAEFSNTFLGTTEPVLRTDKTPRPTTRKATKTDERDYLNWAQEKYADRGYGPSLMETAEFGKERRLNREWARGQHKSLPREMHRERGGSGSARHLAKPRVQVN
jgi:hypothetical protein